jgi:hypothetical protein
MRCERESDLTMSVVSKLALTAIIAAAATMAVQAQPSRAVPEEKLRRVEEAAAHFLIRFNETLDFGVPYREMYIPENVSKRSKSTFTKREAQLDADFEIAMMNLWYLRVAYAMTHDAQELPREINAAGGDELIPFISEPESPREKRARQKNPDRWLMSYLYKAKRLADRYRKYLTPEMFTTDAYKARLEKENLSEWGNGARVRVENSYPYDAFENQHLYKLVYGGIEYWLVEVDGNFKVVHINPLPGFRLGP